MARTLIWLRRDLRLSDNPALHHALARGDTPVPLYIHDETRDKPGAAAAWWLHHSLVALRNELQALGSDLLILQGDSTGLLRDTARHTGAEAVF